MILKGNWWEFSYRNSINWSIKLKIRENVVISYEQNVKNILLVWNVRCLWYWKEIGGISCAEIYPNWLKTLIIGEKVVIHVVNQIVGQYLF